MASTQQMIFTKFSAFITAQGLLVKLDTTTVVTDYQGVKSEDVDEMLKHPLAADYIQATFIVNQFSLKKKNASRIVVTGHIGKKNLETLKACQDVMTIVENDKMSQYNRIVNGQRQSIRGALSSKIILVAKAKLMTLFKTVFETYPGVAKAFIDPSSVFYLRFKNAQVWGAEITELLAGFNRLPMTADKKIDIAAMGHENVRNFIIRRCARAMANCEAAAQSGAMLNNSDKIDAFRWNPTVPDVHMGNLIITLMTDSALGLNTENDVTTLKKLKAVPKIGTVFTYPPHVK